MRRIDFNCVRLAVIIALGTVLVTFAVAHAQGQTPNTNGAVTVVATPAQEPTTTSTKESIYVAPPGRGENPDTKDWNFRVGIPFWAAGTHGTIGARNRKVHIEESFIDTLEDLDFTAALNLEIRKDRWLFFSDGFYIKTSTSGEPRGLFSGGTVELGQKLMINDLAIGYAVVKNECWSLDLFAGAQLSFVEANVSIDRPIPDRTASADRFLADPIVGIYLNYRFCERAGFYTKADVGGFDVSSRLTWQVEGGFDFPLSRHWYARVAYRCLSLDIERRALSFNAIMRGPQVEVGVRF